MASGAVKASVFGLKALKVMADVLKGACLGPNLTMRTLGYSLPLALQLKRGPIKRCLPPLLFPHLNLSSA